MSIVEKIVALLSGLTPEALQTMAPAERRRFADLCRHWADVAEPPVMPRPAAGVLHQLSDGARAD